MIKTPTFVLGLTLSFTTLAASSTTAESEIAYLLDYLGRSGCDFYRNGSWHAAGDARTHIEKKYRYLRKRNKVDNAEEFIRHAASRSSLSGTPYQVRCGGTAPVNTDRWLTDELQRYRRTR